MLAEKLSTASPSRERVCELVSIDVIGVPGHNICCLSRRNIFVRDRCINIYTNERLKLTVDICNSPPVQII